MTDPNLYHHRDLLAGERVRVKSGTFAGKVGTVVKLVKSQFPPPHVPIEGYVRVDTYEVTVEVDGFGGKARVSFNDPTTEEIEVIT